MGKNHNSPLFFPPFKASISRLSGFHFHALSYIVILAVFISLTRVASLYSHDFRISEMVGIAFSGLPTDRCAGGSSMVPLRCLF